MANENCKWQLDVDFDVNVPQLRPIPKPEEKQAGAYGD